ncbi:MAG: hypothetical protein FWC22_08215 [Treponema sp.]|nr:hypothetical protein [Treponema sp.]
MSWSGTPISARPALVTGGNRKKWLTNPRSSLVVRRAYLAGEASFLASVLAGVGVDWWFAKASENVP